MIVYGVNPVLEALRAGRVAKLQISRRVLRMPGDRGGDWLGDTAALRSASQKVGPRFEEVLRLALARRVPIEPVDAVVLDRAAGSGVHQGIVATVQGPDEYSVEELVRGARGTPLLVVLDGVEDPQNLGAILRTADAAGVDGVVLQTRRSAALGGAAAKASAGAVAHVRMARVVNVARAVEELKAAGVWTVGLAVDGGRRYDTIDLTVPAAVVLGSEGTGLRRLVRERCDWLASIPMLGRVASLNVAVAAGVVLFEAVRQRLAAGLIGSESSVAPELAP